MYFIDALEVHFYAWIIKEVTVNYLLSVVDKLKK